jgi:hypothetical protein
MGKRRHPQRMERDSERRRAVGNLTNVTKSKAKHTSMQYITHEDIHE